MKAVVRQFPLLPALAIQSDEVHPCAGKTKSTDAQFIPVEDPSSQRGAKGLTLCFHNI